MLNTSAIEGLKRFLQHAETLQPQNNPRRENGFAKEFQEMKELTSRLKKDPFFSTKHGEKEVNRPKNRYKDILPYDYTRIKLPDNQGVEGSDYINGNYIKGPTKEVFYLTAQGPLPQTVDDFWSMIISHKIQVIVMACREYELGKLKCKRYWPENMQEKLNFGGCEVSMISQEEMGEGFIIRTLAAKSAKVELIVTQFHYTAWPDHDVPRSATPLIELTMSFRSFVGKDNTVPVLVHCSAGCGRTGTICALDYAWTLLKMGKTDHFSVYDIVAKLRRQRIAMVQTKEQYELVYKAVKELVHEEIKKHRISEHTYVNVSVSEQPQEETSLYENVDFIRSIQRLQQEEKNACRKLPPEVDTPSRKDVVSVPKKDLVLVPEKKELSKTTNDVTNANRKEQPVQLASDIPKENPILASTKPPLKQKPASGYENILLLKSSPSFKPPLTPKPAAQNYVNVVIGSSKQDDDYVNVPVSALSKTVPIPGDKTPKPVPVPTGPVPSGPAPPGPRPYGESGQLDKTTAGSSEYVVPPQTNKLRHQLSSDSDYVVPPVSNPTRQPLIPEGKLIDICEAEPKTAIPVEARPGKPRIIIKQSSLESQAITTCLTPPGQPKVAETPSKPTETVSKQRRTNQTSGQYSLVGALESPRSPQTEMKDPFVAALGGHDGVPRTKSRASLGMAELVLSDGSSSKPSVTPRRQSAGCSSKTTDERPQQRVSFPGSYSVVQVPSNENKPDTNEGLLVDLGNRPPMPSAFKSSMDKPTSPTNPQSHNGLIHKAHSTECVSRGVYSSTDKTNKPSTKQPLSKQNSYDSDYTLVTEPYKRRSSQDVLRSGTSTPALYSRADSEGPVKKRSAAIKRSNSGALVPSLPDNMDSLYATVGARRKDSRKLPLANEIWTPSNGHLPASSSSAATAAAADREMKRSQNSSSSLRSITSNSSNDSEHTPPPLPVQTVNAFFYPGDENAYETVQKPTKTKTLERLKSRAKNMITSGTHVPKISLGRKGHSPSNTPGSASPVPGEGQALPAAAQLGYGTHFARPSGPRRCPGDWPTFT